MKYLLTVAFTLSTSGLFAQVTYGVKPDRRTHAAKPRQYSVKKEGTFRLKGGANLTSVFWQESIGARNVKVKTNPGFHAGMAFSIPLHIIRKHFVLEPGVLLTQKGFRQYYEDNLYGKGTLIVSPRYIEMPVNLLFKGDGPVESRFYFGAGGYIACGLNGGNWSIEYSNGRDAGSIEFVNINDQKDKDGRFNYGKKIDIGINGIIGYNITPSIGLELAGQRGLKNIAPTKAGNIAFERFYNAGLMLSAVFILQ